MPKLTPFEAPMTGYHIDDRGSTAYERLGATAREAGQQRSSLLHQEGKSLQQGLTEIGKGMADNNADQKTAAAKADQHDELQNTIATNNEYAKLYPEVLAKYNEYKNKAYDNPAETGDWLKKFTDDYFNPRMQQFRDNKFNSEKETDGKHREHYVESMTSHFLFTIGPAAEMTRSTNAAGSSYDRTRIAGLGTIRGGGNLPADGSEPAMLMALKNNDDAIANQMSSGSFKGDIAKLSELHAEHQHDLVLASAEEWIKSAKSPAEIKQALKDVMDTNRYWAKGDHNRYGLVEDKDIRHLEQVADRHESKLRTAASAAHTERHNAGMSELNTVGNKLTGLALSGQMKAKDLDELYAVAKKYPDVVKPSDVSAMERDIMDHQNHPDKHVVMDRDVVQEYMDRAARGGLSGQEIMSAKARGKIDKDTANELYSMNEKASKLGPGLAKVREDFFKGYTRILDGGYSTVGGFESASALGQAQIFKAKQEAMRLEQEAVDKQQDPHKIYDAPPGKVMPAWAEKYKISAAQAKAFDTANNATEKTIRPTILAPGQNPSTLRKGTQFVIPDGPSKGMIGTVP